MEILIINDSDGHCHAFDVSTTEKATVVFKEILNAYLKYLRSFKLINEDFIERIELTLKSTVISQNDVSDILEEEMDDFPGFGRSQGGRMYLVEVKETGITEDLFL